MWKFLHLPKSSCKVSRYKGIFIYSICLRRPIKNKASPHTLNCKTNGDQTPKTTRSAWYQCLWRRKQRKTIRCLTAVSIRNANNRQHMLTGNYDKWIWEQYLKLEGILSNLTVGESKEIVLRTKELGQSRLYETDQTGFSSETEPMLKRNF